MSHLARAPPVANAKGKGKRGEPPSPNPAVRGSPCGSISSPEFATPPRASKRSAVEMIGDTPNEEKTKQHKPSWIGPLDATYEKPFAGLGRSSGASGKSKPKKKVYAIFNNYETTFSAMILLWKRSLMKS